MTMKNPPHPGLVVLQECIEPSGLTITQSAEALGVTCNTLSELVNGKRGISPEMAVRLSKVFGGTEQGWLVQQARSCASPPRPHKAETAATGLAPPRFIKTSQRAVLLRYSRAPYISRQLAEADQDLVAPNEKVCFVERQKCRRPPR